MFESIIFRRQGNGPKNKPIDLGMLIEAMLFYGSISIVADRDVLSCLLNELGQDGFLELVSEDFLRILFVESNTGIRTATNGLGQQLHDPVILTSPQHTAPEQIRRVCIGVTGKDGKGRRLARRIEPMLSVLKHDPIITRGARDSILNPDYLNRAAQHIISTLIPGIPTAGMTFTGRGVGDRIRIETNIDFGALNSEYHKHVPSTHSSISPAYILTFLIDAECDLYFASTHLAEIATSPLGSKLISEKVSYALHRRDKSVESLAHFQDVTLNDAHAIREALNNGQASVQDAIAAVKASARFKKWLSGIPYDGKLVSEYYKDISKDSWIDKLPGKIFRWAFFTGVGLGADALGAGGLGVPAGLTLSVMDSFLLDKVIKGWKPNQFVETELRRLIEQ